MFRRNIYYTLKPLIPVRLRRAIRGYVARRKLRDPAVQAVWPILESAGEKPAGWPGWPEGKQFAFVLTHDVEGAEGLAKVRQLAELEMSLGFRSAFNFVPEGEYSVPADLRAWLTDNGFEVGVHDLHHDGKLYKSREEFARRAKKINGYIREWGAVGYRSGFMLHNYAWHHDLDVLYDASSFDTDPFEPQPDGVGTIFPFFVPRDEERKDQGSGIRDQGSELTSAHCPLTSGQNLTSDLCPLTSGAKPPQAPVPSSLRPFVRGPLDIPAPRAGYVELPYTLPQDSTLFFLLQEKTDQIWRKKVDWIAGKGGMTLLNTHPDYMHFDSERETRETFAVEIYAGFLRYIATRYADRHWHDLPRDIAALANTTKLMQVTKSSARNAMSSSANKSVCRKAKIWIDLENTPHIPFFNPIIRELQLRGHTVVLTARDAFQTCEMATLYRLDFKKVGRHYGQHMVMKLLGLGIRMLQLLPFVLRERPAIALNHGARAQVGIANLLGIPTVMIMDYEHSATPPLTTPRWEIVPDVIPDSARHCRNADRILKYGGIKEDVYASDLKVDPAILDVLKLRHATVIATVRPPATEAHYHNPEAELMFVKFMERLIQVPGARCILLPRNQRQRAWIESRWPHWFEGEKVLIPGQVVDGLNLIWHSDLVVSGGGTMNREAAALGVPVFSIFRGQMGAVDRHLAAEGRLVLIESLDDVDRKIPIVPRRKPPTPQFGERSALTDIVDHIETIIRQS